MRISVKYFSIKIVFNKNEVENTAYTFKSLFGY